jgi:hypothetical protein
MEAEPVQSLSASGSQEWKDQFRSENSEEAIQACHDLLASGHSLSEILVALKRFGPLNTASQSERDGGRADTQIFDQAGEPRAASPQWQTAQVTQPIKSRLLDQARDLSGALVRTDGDASHSLVALSVQQSTRVEHVKNTRPIRAVLLWLMPLISLMVVGIAGKPLIDAGLTRNTAAHRVVPIAIPSRVEAAEDLTTPPTEAAEIGAPVITLPKASRTAPAITPKRPTVPNSTPATRQQRSAPPRHTRIQRPFAMGWKTPSRLTDGL